ncbi:MAG TPA: EF-hand domain-containing protein [Rhodanobacteraceae bacterium]|nr:EF-hand domain-containing protein [Rhodanobacteraceae bacterium]
MSRHAILAALFALLPAAAACAQSAGNTASDAAPATRNPSHPDAFDETDTNNDGVITREEYLAFTRKYFDKLDTNHDHKVDANEVAHSPPMMERNLHSAEQMVGKWDANKDGVVTVEEYQAFANARFTKEDKTGTGKIAKPTRGKPGTAKAPPAPPKPNATKPKD